MKKLVIMLVMVVLFTGCIFESSSRNWFEVQSRVGQITMQKIIDDEFIEDMKNPASDFIIKDTWDLTCQANNIQWDSYFGLPKKPSDAWEDIKDDPENSSNDCVNLSILANWGLGYDNLVGWGVLGVHNEEMHQISIFVIDGRMAVVSNTGDYWVDSAEEFIEKIMDGYTYCNIYDKFWENEYNLKEGLDKLINM